MAAATVARSPFLRVAAVWGTTVVATKLLRTGESFQLGEAPGDAVAMPDGIAASPAPVRAVASGWEVDARGVTSGLMKLRGREEDPSQLGRSGAPVPIVPGDWGLLQYGAFAVFYQFVDAPPPLPSRRRRELLVGLALASSVLFHGGVFGLIRTLTTPTALPKPVELSNPEELAERFGITKAAFEEPPPVAAGAEKSAGGSGVKDPGAHDTKKSGGGRKVAGDEGRLGKQGDKDHTEMQGEPKQALGGMSDVLQGETGDEIRHTLGTISSVAAALGGLNSESIVLGAGSGTGLKGAGSGGGGKGPGGVLFGAGTLDTGWGRGNGGGFGAGAGGPGGAGRGGPGNGGTGTGTGTGSGSSPGERKISVSAGGGSGGGGLSPEQIRRVVMSHVGALRACYESELDKNPSLAGGVTIAWQIAPGGNVTGASLAGSSLGNPRAEGCMLRQVRAWRFPSSDGASSATFPFRFGVKGG